MTAKSPFVLSLLLGLCLTQAHHAAAAGNLNARAGPVVLTTPLPLLLLGAIVGSVLGLPEAVPATPMPVKICFSLPSTYTGTVGVTVAVVDKENTDWIITHACYLQPFNVTAGKQQQGCIGWDGIDENFWPVPPGTYGLKGIMTNVSYWPVDKKYHAITVEATGAVGPVPIDLTAPAEKQSFFVDGDPVGSSFTSIGINTNFPGSNNTYANLYNSYLENAYNNYLVDLAKPHGSEQRVWRWHDAGIGGGMQTATNGLSVWSQTSLSGEHLYRGDVGNENVAIWGNCSFAFFYQFPGARNRPLRTCNTG
jgi:hypothetical protein